MFPSRYFPDRMFAPRYFPKVGSSVVAPVIDIERTHNFIRTATKAHSFTRTATRTHDFIRTVQRNHETS